MDKVKENHDYFQNIVNEAPRTQMKMRNMISRAQKTLRKDGIIHHLIVGECRNTKIESQMDLTEEITLVIKSTQFKDEVGYSFDFVNLKENNIINSKNHEYYGSKEEATMAAMIMRLGGTSTIICATNLMIAGQKKD